MFFFISCSKLVFYTFYIQTSKKNPILFRLFIVHVQAQIWSPSVYQNVYKFRTCERKCETFRKTKRRRRKKLSINGKKMFLFLSRFHSLCLHLFGGEEGGHIPFPNLFSYKMYEMCIGYREEKKIQSKVGNLNVELSWILNELSSKKKKSNEKKKNKEMKWKKDEHQQC